MKKIIIPVAVALVLTAGFTGCKKFLDIKPVGARFLTDLETVANTMGSWMNNFSMNGKSSNTKDGPGIWTPYHARFLALPDVWSFHAWDVRSDVLTADEKRVIDRAAISDTWSNHYELIGFMNLIITEGKTAKGDNNLRDVLLGEAYIQRAFYLFKLLQYYAPVDDPSLGIVVYTDIHNSVSEADLSRKPQKAVYDQILSDIRESETILARTQPDPGFNIMFGGDWIYRIAAKVYHYRAGTAAGEDGDWENAVKYSELAMKAPTGTGQMALPFDIYEMNSDKVLSSRPSAINVTFALKQGYPETVAIVYDAYSQPIPNTYTYGIDTWNTLYKDGDLRKTMWFLPEDKWDTPPDEISESDISPEHKVKGAYYSGYAALLLLRLAEQWLIRVEALAMGGRTDEARQALSTWRSLRYSNTSELSMPSTAEEIQHEVYLERKREFLGPDDILWLDMKRFKVSDTRRVQDFSATLGGDDFRYQFPLPDKELEFNPNIKINPGWATLVY